MPQKKRARVALPQVVADDSDLQVVSTTSTSSTSNETSLSTEQTNEQQKRTEVKEGESKEEEELQCGICFETVKIRGKIDSCEHPYCYDCISKWAKESNTCPFCKARFHSMTKIDPSKKRKPRKVKVKHKDIRPQIPDPLSWVNVEDDFLSAASSAFLLEMFTPTRRRRNSGGPAPLDVVLQSLNELANLPSSNFMGHLHVFHGRSPVFPPIHLDRDLIEIDDEDDEEENEPEPELIASPASPIFVDLTQDDDDDVYVPPPPTTTTTTRTRTTTTTGPSQTRRNDEQRPPSSTPPRTSTRSTPPNPTSPIQISSPEDGRRIQPPHKRTRDEH